jgi:hypothetical protein
VAGPVRGALRTLAADQQMNAAGRPEHAAADKVIKNVVVALGASTFAGLLAVVLG